MRIWMRANPRCEECNSRTNRRRKKPTGNTQRPTICAVFFYPCFITIRKHMKNILFVTHIHVQIHQGPGQEGGSEIDPSLY